MFKRIASFIQRLRKLPAEFRKKEIMRGYRCGKLMIHTMGHVAASDCFEHCCSYPLDWFDKGFDVALKRHTVDEFDRLFGEAGLEYAICYTDNNGKEVAYYAKGQLHEGPFENTPR